MHYSDIFLNLINFELITAISNRSVVLLVIMQFMLLGWIVKKLVPVELLVVSRYVLTVSDRFLLRYTQFHTDPLYQLRSRYLLSCQKIPYKRDLADDDLHVTISNRSVFLVIEVVKAELDLLLECAIVDLVQKLNKFLACALNMWDGT